MTAFHTSHGTIAIRCSAPDCTATFGALDTYLDVYPCRVDAQELGWDTYIGSLPFKDLCPAHAAREDEQ